MSAGEKLWGGRFQSSLDPGIHRYTAALAFDRRLVRHDLIGSLAHARMLFEQGILESGDAAAILGGLSALLRDVESGALEVEGDDEDIHSWIERLLGERIGEPALRLHTARSRNDQTSTALRLYVRERLVELQHQRTELQELWAERAKTHVETWLPGYTHLQRGQPVSLAHHLLAHFWSLDADGGRLGSAFESAGWSVLGAGALAGSPHPIEPRRSAALLGFDRLHPNSMLAVADRDYVLEAAFACTVIMLHLSRWASEVVLWTSAEFGFARLEDSVAKGSSLMPQKRNPEPAEILRGKTGRVVGDLMALTMVVKGLPMTYNSDLQEDKESLFDALDTTESSLACAATIGRGLQFRPEAMMEALSAGYLTATDLADYLVRKGVPFRTAHHDAGAVVLTAERRGVELWDLKLEELQAVNPSVEEDVFSVLEPEGSVRSRKAYGGPAPERVEEQLEEALQALAAARTWLAARPPIPIYNAFLEDRLMAEDLE